MNERTFSQEVIFEGRSYFVQITLSPNRAIPEVTLQRMRLETWPAQFAEV